MEILKKDEIDQLLNVINSQKSDTDIPDAMDLPNLDSLFDEVDNGDFDFLGILGNKSHFQSSDNPIRQQKDTRKDCEKDVPQRVKMISPAVSSKPCEICNENKVSWVIQYLDLSTLFVCKECQLSIPGKIFDPSKKIPDQHKDYDLPD